MERTRGACKMKFTLKNEIIPCEVKSSGKGSMQSLHSFLVPIGHRTEYVCQWKTFLNMRIFMYILYILYMQSVDW